MTDQDKNTPKKPDALTAWDLAAGRLCMQYKGRFYIA